MGIILLFDQPNTPPRQRTTLPNRSRWVVFPRRARLLAPLGTSAGGSFLTPTLIDSTATAQTGAANTVTFTKPTTVHAGSWIFLFVGQNNNPLASIGTMPTGFSLVAGRYVDGTNTGLDILGRYIPDASTAAGISSETWTLTWAAAATTKVTAVCEVWDNVDTTTPFDAENGAPETAASGSVTQHVTPTITVSGPQRVLVDCYADRLTGGVTYTDSSGDTLVQNISGAPNGSNAISMYTAYSSTVGAGSYSRTIAVSPNTAAAAVAWIGALKPLASSGATGAWLPALGPLRRRWALPRRPVATQTATLATTTVVTAPPITQTTTFRRPPVVPGRRVVRPAMSAADDEQVRPTDRQERRIVQPPPARPVRARIGRPTTEQTSPPPAGRRRALVEPLVRRPRWGWGAVTAPQFNPPIVLRAVLRRLGVETPARRPVATQVPPAQVAVAPTWVARLVRRTVPVEAPARRARTATPVPAQQALVTATWLPGPLRRRLVEVLAARTRTGNTVTAPWPTQDGPVKAPARRPAPAPGARRGRAVSPAPEQPFTPAQGRARRPVQGPARRGTARGVVPPQFNPPWPPRQVGARRWWALARRPATVVRVQEQQPAVPNPPYPVVEVRRRLYAALARRTRAVGPVPAQQAIVTSIWLPAPVRVRLVEALARRARTASPAPAQPTPAGTPRPRRLVVPSLRRRPTTVTPEQPAPPAVVRARRTATGRRPTLGWPRTTPAQVNPPWPPRQVLRRVTGYLPVRGRARMPVPNQQAAAPAPPWQPWWVRVRLAGSVLARRTTARTPVPAQVNPPYPPTKAGARRWWALARRPATVTPTPAQTTVTGPAYPTRPSTPPRRAWALGLLRRRTTPVDPAPTPRQPARRPAPPVEAPARRTRTVVPPPAQAGPPNTRRGPRVTAPPGVPRAHDRGPVPDQPAPPATSRRRPTVEPARARPTARPSARVVPAQANPAFLPRLVREAIRYAVSLAPRGKARRFIEGGRTPPPLLVWWAAAEAGPSWEVVEAGLDSSAAGWHVDEAGPTWEVLELPADPVGEDPTWTATEQGQ